MSLNDREKAAIIFGMVRAFQASKWPKHFNKEDKSQWIQRAKSAKLILGGGAYNPIDHWSVTSCADDELAGEEFK